LVTQAVPTQAKPVLHAVIVTAGQIPDALQFAAAIWVVLSKQEAVRQLVGGGAQTPPAAQRPVDAHTPEPMAHAMSAVPEATGAQAPFPTEHELHVPQAAVEQQTPSTQLPVAHSESAAHFTPSPDLGGTHILLLQT